MAHGGQEGRRQDRPGSAGWRRLVSDDGRKVTMNIIEKHVYQSATLPGAPERATRTEAEADEARGIELAAYLALLPGLTAEQADG